MEPLVCGAAADAIESMQNRVSELEAARIAYASEFQPDAEGLPDTGNIHANIRAMKAQVAALQSRLEVTENAPDGIACRDMTIEMLEKRIKELEGEREAWRNAVIDELVTLNIACKERAERKEVKLMAYLSNDHTQFFIPLMEGKDVKHASYMAHWMAGWTPLYAAPSVTSDAVNKAFADGKAEGHGIACQEPALYVQTDHFAQARTAPFLARVFQQPIEGVATLPFYAAPPVTAPVRITDEQVEHALRTNGAYESDAAYAMAKDGLLTDARAVETAVLRANGFKVDNQ